MFCHHVILVLLLVLQNLPTVVTLGRDMAGIDVEFQDRLVAQNFGAVGALVLLVGVVPLPVPGHT